MKILDVWHLIGFPVLAEDIRCMFQKLLLPLCDLVRMHLVPLASSTIVWSPLRASKATFALNAGA